MIPFARSRAQLDPMNWCIELDLRGISCHQELTNYYITQFSDKFDIVDYFCIFSDGIEDKIFIEESKNDVD